jgi:MFS superfamily sulfate permease-like transporter
VVQRQPASSQLAQITAAVVVLIVLLLLTGPLGYLPDAALAAVLTRVVEHLRKRHIHLAISNLPGPVREQFGRYGISAALGPNA